MSDTEQTPPAPYEARRLCWRLHSDGVNWDWRCVLELGHTGPCRAILTAPALQSRLRNALNALRANVPDTLFGLHQGSIEQAIRECCQHEVLCTLDPTRGAIEIVLVPHVADGDGSTPPASSGSTSSSEGGAP